MSQSGNYIPNSGPGSGTVTSIAAGTGITLTPNPITTTGTVALTVPVAIANGGTDNTGAGYTTDGVFYYDGTRFQTTSAGTATYVLTSNGAGVAPTYQTVSASGAVTSVSGGNNITITGTATAPIVNVSGTTNHSLLLGNATGSINSLGVAINGQLPIGSAGADPVLATLTSGMGISISNGAGSITISATGTTTLNYTLVNSSPYVVAATDDFLGVDSSGGAITVQLPNAPATGRVYIIKDKTGSAAAHNITVTTVGGAVNIDGATSFVMNTAYESVSVLFDGATYEVY